MLANQIDDFALTFGGIVHEEVEQVHEQKIFTSSVHFYIDVIFQLFNVVFFAAENFSQQNCFD